jgi:hypothetical protein
MNASSNNINAALNNETLALRKLDDLKLELVGDEPVILLNKVAKELGLVVLLGENELAEVRVLTVQPERRELLAAKVLEVLDLPLESQRLLVARLADSSGLTLAELSGRQTGVGVGLLGLSALAGAKSLAVAVVAVSSYFTTPQAQASVSDVSDVSTVRVERVAPARIVPAVEVRESIVPRVEVAVIGSVQSVEGVASVEVVRSVEVPVTSVQVAVTPSSDVVVVADERVASVVVQRVATPCVERAVPVVIDDAEPSRVVAPVVNVEMAPISKAGAVCQFVRAAAAVGQSVGQASVRASESTVAGSFVGVVPSVAIASQAAVRRVERAVVVAEVRRASDVAVSSVSVGSSTHCGSVS